MNKQEKLRLKLDEMSEFEKSLWSRGIEYVAGVDEVGRGCIAGPVVAACVVLPKDWNIVGLDDSKKLSEKKREEMYDIIKKNATMISVGMIEHDVIDEINILNATKQAMKGAISSVDKKLFNSLSTNVQWILIDAVKLDDISIPQSAIIKGDTKSISIAAASIVAKVTRDRLMKEMAKKYPHYSFEKNKGYGTKAHYEAIANHGICEIHRKTFLKKYFK